MVGAVRRNHPGFGKRSRDSGGGKVAPSMTNEQVIVVNLSGRGDKDVNTVAETLKKPS